MIQSGPGFWDKLIAQNAQPKQNPITTQPVKPATSQVSSQSSSQSQPVDMTGQTSYMWKDGQLTSVNNSSVDKYKGLGYELDSGQLGRLQSGTPDQGYGTLRGLPQGMSDDDYFRENMGMSASDYYMSQASNPQGQQAQQGSAGNSDTDARIKALERMIEEMTTNTTNSSNYAKSEIANTSPYGQGNLKATLPNEDDTPIGTPEYRAKILNTSSDKLHKYLTDIWQGGL